MSKYDEDEIHWSDEEDHIFDSPTGEPKGRKFPGANGRAVDAKIQTKTRPEESRYDSEQSREATLNAELQNVRKINQVIEGVVESLEKAKGNLETVSHTVNSASTLLQTWTRILSQTEHNQRLILNPEWHGASQDLADIEAEEANRERNARRRQIEEQQMRESAARKAENEERRRADAAARGARGTRGRARGTGRAKSTVGSSTSAYLSGGTQSGRGAGRGTTPTPTRAGTSIGRGLRGSGRGRG